MVKRRKCGEEKLTVEMFSIERMSSIQGANLGAAAWWDDE